MKTAGSRLKQIIALAIFPAMMAAQVDPEGVRGGGKPGGRLKVSPDTIFFTKAGSETTLTRTVEVHRVGPPGQAPATFTAVASTNSGGNWLTVSPSSGPLPVPSRLTLTATPGALTGTHTGKVTITAPGQGSPLVVNVVLRILIGPSGAPAVFVRPDSLHFTMVQGGANPAPKTLSVSSPTGGASFTWSASRSISTPSGGTWLQPPVPGGGTGPGLITVSVVGTGLTAGIFTGTLTVVSGSITVQVPVTLEVKGPGSPEATPENDLVLAPRGFNFIVHPGAPSPGPKILHVKQLPAGSPNWTATRTASPAQGDHHTRNCAWLTLNPTGGNGSGDIRLSVNPTGIARGSQECDVKVSAGSQTDTARVFLRVVGPPAGDSSRAPGAGSSAVQIVPRAVEFSSTGGTVTPASVSVQLSSAVSGLTFTATRTTGQGGNWLNISPASGTIHGTITVTANATGLAPATYTGLITVMIAGAVQEQRSIPVVLQVLALQTTTAHLGLIPSGVAFTAASGGANPAPAIVNLQALGAASIPFQATASTTTGGNWLSVVPPSGTAPAVINVLANISGLAAGVYNGAVVFTATGTNAVPATLNVVLTISQPAGTSSVSTNIRSAAVAAGPIGLFLEPASEFTGIANSPISVRVMVINSDGMPLEGAAVTVTPSDGGAPLALEDVGGGTYSGVFRSMSGGPVALTATASTDAASAAPFGIGGDLEGSPQTTPVIFQGGVVSAANFAPAETPVAPGAILSLFGQNLTDSTAEAFSFPLPRELAGVRVLVGGLEAPLLFVSAGDGSASDQINFQLPAEMSDFSFAEVVVDNNGVLSAPEGLNLASSVPGFFTQNGRGFGAVAALHADFSPVTADQPAHPGETVLLFATGLGVVQPAVASGEAAGSDSGVMGEVEATIAGQAAAIDFAGLAPGWAGLYQINVRMPDDLSPGDATLVLTVDGISSGEGVVIPVR